MPTARSSLLSCRRRRAVRSVPWRAAAAAAPSPPSRSTAVSSGGAHVCVVRVRAAEGRHLLLRCRLLPGSLRSNAWCSHGRVTASRRRGIFSRAGGRGRTCCSKGSSNFIISWSKPVRPSTGWLHLYLILMDGFNLHHLTLDQHHVFLCLESRLIISFNCKCMLRKEANSCLHIAVIIYCSRSKLRRAIAGWSNILFMENFLTIASPIWTISKMEIWGREEAYSTTFTMNPNNQHFKDEFKGDVQLHTRMCAMRHYPFIIEPLSPIGRLPAQTIPNAINRRFETKVEPIVDITGEEKMVIFFPGHWEAVQAFRLADERNTLYVSGIPYRFTIYFLQSHLMRIQSNQGITISMKGLSLYLRSNQIVEQILSPYCLLDYVPDDTNSVADLTVFTCMVRT